MGYTYDDFVTAANKAGLMGQFSQQDLETARKSPEFGLSILRLKQDVAGATTQEQKILANAAANQLRATYGGYTGGSDGSGNMPVANGSGRTEGSFENDAYMKVLSDANGKFAYDPDSDPNVSTIRKAYRREGERAAADALAQASASTGGIPSSYAVSAAQQAANYYTGQAADNLPALEKEAYQRYLDAVNMGLIQTGSENAGNGGGSGAGTGYNNGSLTPEQVMQLQSVLNVTVDGKYGPATSAAVGGLSADDAYAMLIEGGLADGEIANNALVQALHSNAVGGAVTGVAKDLAAGDPEPAAGNAPGGLPINTWNRTVVNLQQLFNHGDQDEVMRYVEQIAGSLSREQFSQLETMLRAAGYL